MCGIELVAKVICTCYLGILSWMDIKTKRIPMWILGAGILAAFVFRVLQRKQMMVLWLSGGAVGLVFLVVGKITREALGYGDGVLIGILGIYLGIWDLLCLLLTAFFLAALYAAGLLTVRKFRKKTAFPFVPFLGMAYIFMLVAGGG